MSDCVFCDILAGESPASVFYEDDAVLGIMTIGPVTDGHTLILPKQHAPYLADLDEDTGRRVWTVAQRTAAALRASGVRCEGVNMFLADGEAAFQEIFHLHLHVFPRYHGDPFKLVANWEDKPPRDALDRLAQQIASAYGRFWSDPPANGDALSRLRTQYYFRDSPRGLLAWDVHRLIGLSHDLPRREIALSEIRELDEPWTGDGESHTWRAMLEHLHLIDAAELRYPIILSADGSVMDGMHRVMRALREGRRTINAVQFTVDPDPDHIGRGPDDLPY